MIIYFDTSALVKAYVTELASKEVLSLINKSDVVASHMLAYVEAIASFSRVKREKIITEKDYEVIKKDFVKDWSNYFRIECTPSLLQEAADLADAFALRAYDSVHLAAAKYLLQHAKQDIYFACFDLRLTKAAKILGLKIPFENYES